LRQIKVLHDTKFTLHDFGRAGQEKSGPE